MSTAHKYRRLLGQSFEERPAEVDSREAYGHFEIDTIVGKRDGQESVILTLIERQTRFQIIRLIDGRNADSVAYAMKSIIAEYRPIIKSITADNGPEFTTLPQVLPQSTLHILTRPASAAQTRSITA